MKLKSLKLAIALALGAPLLISSGAAMAITPLEDIVIEEGSSSAVDQQTVTTAWTGGATGAEVVDTDASDAPTGSSPVDMGLGLGGTIGNLRPMQLVNYDTSCQGVAVFVDPSWTTLSADGYAHAPSSGHCYPGLASGFTSPAEVAYISHSDSTEEQSAKSLTFAMGASGYLMSDVDVTVTFGGSGVVYQGTANPAFRIRLMHEGKVVKDMYCNRKGPGVQSDHVTSGGVKTHWCDWASNTSVTYPLKFDDALKVDEVQFSGDGGTMSNGAVYSVTKFGIAVNGGAAEELDL